jgi:hypothetical protein
MRANNRQNDCTIVTLSHYCHHAIVIMLHAWHHGKWIVTWPCDGRQTQVIGVVSFGGCCNRLGRDTTSRTALVLQTEFLLLLS